MRAFVTGGNGFLGIHLVRLLLANSWTVSVLVRKTSDLSLLAGLDVELVEGDLLDPEAWEGHFSQNYDAVFHLVADNSLWSARHKIQDRINIEGTKNIARLALKYELGRFIYTSSASVWGFHEEVINESSEKAGAKSAINFVRSKFFAEQEILSLVQEGLDAVIINPCLMMGPHDLHGWSQLFPLMKQGKIKALPSGTGTFCHVADVAKAHLAAFERGRRGACYLLGGERVSYARLSQKIASMLETEPPKSLPSILLKSISVLSTMKSWLTWKEPVLSLEKLLLLSHDLKVDDASAEKDLLYQSSSLDKILNDTFSSRTDL